MPSARVIKTDGTETELDHRPTYKEAVDVVGGYIEFAKGKLGDRTITIVLDEEGKLKGKSKNSKATLMYWSKYPHIGDIIVGDVIVLEGWQTVGG